MGRKVYVPTESDLLSATHLYGFEHDSGLRKRYKARHKELVGRMQALDREIERMSRERILLQGADQQVAHFLQSYAVPDHTSMEPDHPEIPAEAV
jgi:hypothetical protein